MHQNGLSFIIAALVALVASANATAAPKTDLWSRWQVFDADSTTEVDHSAWDRFLGRYLEADHPSGINRMHYARVRSADKVDLMTYLETLQNTAVSRLNRNEQAAYWINLYNAGTVKVILDHYPVSSITKIDLSSGLFSRGPWEAKIFRIEGQEVSLNDVEHRILRPIWKDPRIHYAVNCASLGCPNLQKRAYSATNLEVLLEKGAREYVNHPRGVFLHGRKLVLSSIYDWFQEDFAGNQRGVISHLLDYAEPELAAKLENYPGRISFEYDWSLNE